MKERRKFKEPHRGEFKLPLKPGTKVSHKDMNTEIESLATEAGVWWYYLKNGAGPLAEGEFEVI